MKSLRLFTMLAFGFALISGFTATPSKAHPHAWIDIRSVVQFDDRGNITAVKFDWFFDEFYSAYVTEDLKNQGKLTQDGLRDLGRTSLSNLRSLDYFTDFQLDGAKQSFQPVDEFRIGVKDGKLWLAFELKLTKPVNPRAGVLNFAVYDPTYFVEILYVKGDVVGLAGAGSNECQARITDPAPSEEVSGLAASLDRLQTAGDGLGGYFAQRVSVECK